MDQPLAQYIADIEAHSASRAQTLLGDRSFLTLAGFTWLHPGENCFGTDSTNDIVLPEGSAPACAGSFHLEGNQVRVTASPGVPLTTEQGEPVTTMSLQADDTGTPDYLVLGRLTMLILKRGDGYALRLYDLEHPARTHFAGLRWYPIRPDLRVVAEFVPYDPPKVLPIVEVIGTTYATPSPGYACWEWEGREFRLDAQDRGARLFYNFRDATNGDTTYGAGRFLYGSLPVDGKVVLDFNQATNPFCAYSPHATCPLPPADNRLDIRVEAGEMTYPGPLF